MTSGLVDWSGLVRAGGAVDSVVVVGVVGDEEAGGEDVEDDVASLLFTTTKPDDSLSQVAQTSGLGGSTSKRATPSSQQ